MADWKTKAKEMYLSGVTYRQIAKELNVPEGSVNYYIATKVLPEVRDTKEDVLKRISKGISVTEVSGDVINELRALGYNISSIDGKYILSTAVERTSTAVDCDWKGEKIIRFGVVSDTHMGNKYQQITYLNEFYDIMQREGITKVYHAGDITDGLYNNRSEQIYELFAIGFDQQKDNVVDSYPMRPGIETDFVLGNHDVTHVRNGGANIGRPIENERPDMRYLGALNVKINLTPNCTMEINHPLDGMSYAVSYSIQKLMESYQGDDKPNILINGHHHKALYLPYRNIHGIEAGCFEAQTPYMKGKRLRADMGGWLVEILVDDEGTIKKFQPAFFMNYRAVQNDY